jgi:hypothetical protein
LEKLHTDRFHASSAPSPPSSSLSALPMTFDL